MKCIILSRRNYLTGAICFLLAALTLLVAGSTIGNAVAVSSTPRKIPIYCVEKDEKVISISFDAAWGNEDTQQLIDILAKYNIKATFFIVGQWVDKYPESVKALADAGHEIQNHSATHPHMPQLSQAQMLEEINTCNDKIESITGVRPTLLRPPYGDYNNTLVETLQSAGMYCIQWDVDSLDWKDLSASDICSRVTSRVKPGSIVLFHNAAKNTPAALPSILENLLAQGYRFVPISELIYPNVYETDHEGRQHPAKTAAHGSSLAPSSVEPTASSIG